MAQEEIAELEPAQTLKEQLLVAMLPQDDSDHRNIIMEIRAGAGGNEASLFTGDLPGCHRFTKIVGGGSSKWVLTFPRQEDSRKSAYDKGEDVYKTSFESGVHRVQRIPVTETNGRIHTSTSTVAVLPEAEDVDIIIDNNDLEITVCRASGPGGQVSIPRIQLFRYSTNLQV